MNEQVNVQMSGQTNGHDINHNDDDGNWFEVGAELQRRFPNWQPPSRAVAAVSDGVASYSSYAGPVASARAVNGPPIVRAFWWGFHIECSSQGLRDFISVADPVNKIAAAIGPITGPAAPFVWLAAAAIAGMLELLRALDRGQGVYISMSWFLPGIFIPTTVTSGRSASVAGRRGLGEPYEQAGDVWQRRYDGGLFGLRLEDDIFWNLPDGTVRDQVVLHTNPPNFGNIYVRDWLSPDPTVGHFRLHVGVAAWRSGLVQIRMMIRDVDGRSADGRSATASVTPGPRALTDNELI